MANNAKIEALIIKIHNAIANGDDVLFSTSLTEAIKNKADINLINAQGHTALYSAASAGRTQMVSHLLALDPEVNYLSPLAESALHAAARSGNVDILTDLINSGANIDLVNSDGQTPLQVAHKHKQDACVEALRQNGAYFQEKRSNSCKEETFHEKSIKMYNDLEDATNQVIAQPLSQGEFVQSIISKIEKYLNKKIGNVAHKQLQNKLEQIYGQLLTVRKEKDNNLQRYQMLNIVRKIIGSIMDYVKTETTLNRNPETYLIMSKIESQVEEEIVRAKANQTVKITPIKAIPSQTQSPLLSKPVTNITISSKPVDWYKEKKHGSFEEFKTQAQLGNNPSLPYFKYLDVSREKILCHLTNREICLLESVTIAPKFLSSQEEARQLFATAEKRLLKEGTHSKIEKLLEKTNLTPADLIVLDHILRPGKSEEMHIINFMPRTNYYENSWSDITEQAFITGATIHSFNYPGINGSEGAIKHKNDFVCAGIAIVNKLLDEGIHPDKIMLHGYCSGVDIVAEVVKQFRVIGNVELTCFNYNITKPTNDIGPRILSTYTASDSLNTNGKTEKSHSPETFANYRIFLEAESRDLRLNSNASKNKLNPQAWRLREVETISGLSYFQLLNYFIIASQQFLGNHAEFQNPPFPKTRVEYVKEDNKLSFLRENETIEVMTR
jgi:hypothetical protein